MRKFFSTMTNENRLQIIEHLLDGPASVTDIAEALNTHQSNVSRNAKDLCNAKLVTRRKESTNIIYKLSSDLAESIFLAVRREVS
jgi:ArsR family transcriptional regulator